MDIISPLSPKIKLAIADDHKILRQTIINCLEQEEPRFEFVLEVENGQKLIDQIIESRAKIIILDLSMPVLNGWQTLQVLKDQFPNLKTIILSMHNSDYHILKAIKLGARAVLPKECDIEELVEVIHAVRTIGYYHNRSTSIAVHRGFLEVNGIDNNEFTSLLTQREREIINLICSGMTNLQISEKLFLSKRTIESHRKSILQKTECKNVAELVVFAIKNKLYEIEGS